MEYADITAAKTDRQLRVEPLDLEIVFALVEHSPEPVLSFNAEGTVLYVNSAFSELTGWSLHEVNLSGIQVWKDKDFTQSPLALKELACQEFAGNLYLLVQNNSTFPVEVKCKAFAHTSGVQLTNVYLKDLRSFYQAEEQIAAQQQQLETALTDVQLVLEKSADMICTFDLQGNFLTVNHACSAILGYTPQELVGRSYQDFIHPDDVAITQQDTVQVQKKYITNNFKNRYLHKNGSLVYLSWSSSLFKERNLVYCIARDITENYAIEKKHLENENRLEALLQEGFDMVSIVDQEGRYTYVSGSIVQILGFSPEYLIGKTAFDFIHPEDLPAITDNFRQVSEGKNVQTRPFRFRSAINGWCWLESKGVNCFHNPAIQGIIINSRNISDQIEDKKRLHLSEKRYQALFENNPDCVFSLSNEGRFTSLNAASIALSGYSEEQLLSMNFLDILHPDWVEITLSEFLHALKGGAFTSETTIITGRGEVVNLDFTKIPVVVDDELVAMYCIAKDITHRKNQELLQQSTAKRLNNILESIKDAFFTLDKDWCFTYVNQQFEEALEVKGSDLYGEDIRHIYPPEEFGRFYRKFNQALSEKKPVYFEEYFSELSLWLGLSVFPSEEGLSITVRGINARKEAEAELKKLSLVASKTVNSVYITDQDARIEWVNDGFTRVSGYTLEEVLGRKPGDLLASPATRNKVLAIREKLNITEPFVQEVENISKFGETYWSKLDVTPIFDEDAGGVKKFIVIETDITQQKRADEDRAKLTEELVRRNRHLEQFTYIVSHNLRSPVANVLGLTSLLNKIETNELQKGLIDRLQQTAQNLDIIIRDLNDLLSLHSGLLEKRETVLLHEVVEQALQVLPAHSFQQVAINLNGINELESSRMYLNSILNNLLTNAVKYRSPDRPLKIEIHAERTEDCGMLCLSVSDNGLGINLAKEGKNLFGLYKRFHFHVPGRGLGLYLVKTQAEALGGHVSVESEPGVGSTFKVCLMGAFK